MEKEAIPTQQKGASFDIREAFSVDERDEAVTRYEAAKKCLLDEVKGGWRQNSILLFARQRKYAKREQCQS